MCNMSRFGLQQEHQVAILLCLVVIWESAFLKFLSILEMTGYLILLSLVRLDRAKYRVSGLTSSKAMRF